MLEVPSFEWSHDILLTLSATLYLTAKEVNSTWGDHLDHFCIHHNMLVRQIPQGPHYISVIYSALIFWYHGPCLEVQACSDFGCITAFFLPGFPYFRFSESPSCLKLEVTRLCGAWSPQIKNLMKSIKCTCSTLSWLLWSYCAAAHISCTNTAVMALAHTLMLAHCHIC